MVVELHMTDGRTVGIQSAMTGAYPFLDHAFAAWCRQTWRDPESFPFTSAIISGNNPRNRHSRTSTMTQFPGNNLSMGNQDPVSQEAVR